MRIAPTLSACTLLLLTACDVRQDADETAEPAAEPAAEPTADAILPVQPQGEENAVASIIREEALPGPIIELPPEPLRQTIPFAESGTDLSTRAERLLAGILESDAIEEDWPIILRGHTDSTGNDQANLRASRARAEAVAAWLVERGVDDARIEVIAMGEQNPVALNALPDGTPDEEGRARNRRVEVEIAAPQPPSGADETNAADADEEEPGNDTP